MALTPQELRDATFDVVKRNGLDPDAVARFKAAAADALQEAIQNATAMEARARAAVAQLQKLSTEAQAAPAPTPAPEPAVAAPVEPEAPVRREPTVDESETISRTLLLAQRTADAAIAEAERDAADIRSAADAQAVGIIEAAKAASVEAAEVERIRVEEEVQALLARRDFLESDADQLDSYVMSQRERITEVVAELEALTNRVPNGLAAMRRPQLSASDTSDAIDVVPADVDIDADAELDVSDLIDEVIDPDASAEIARIADPEAAEQRHSLFDGE